MFEIIPVLDLMNNIAVSGQSGNRSQYKPLETIYSDYPNPIGIAQSLKLNNANQIYIADLDAIESKGNNLESVSQVNMLLPVILDCGVSSFESFSFALNYAQKVIVPTETVNDLETIYNIFDTYPKERIVLSIDIKNNELYSKNIDLTLEQLEKELTHIAPEEIILLDITQVGTNKGFNKKLIEQFQNHKKNIILGGGITPTQIQELKKIGIKKALVGTALHNGLIKI